jgi:hypothetical protein
MVSLAFMIPVTNANSSVVKMLTASEARTPSAELVNVGAALSLQYHPSHL